MARKIKITKKKVWTKFSRYFRLKNVNSRGYGKCYTCDRWFHWKQLQAGHGLSGRTNAILFDEEVIRLQCMQCNVFKGGEYDIFHNKLIKENGQKWFSKKVKQKRVIKKYPPKELEKLYYFYHNEAKKYEHKDN